MCIRDRVDREVRVHRRLHVQLSSEGLLLDLDVDDGSEVRGEEAFKGCRPVPKKTAREALDLQRARADGGRGGLRQLDRERWWDDRRGGVGGAGGGGGYFGGGGGQTHNGCCADGAGGGGSGFMHSTLITDGVLTQGEGTVAEGVNGITIGAAAIETSIADIEADYLVHADKDELESEITAIEQTVANFSATASTLSADVAAIQTALSALPSAADVATRFSASGGTLSGAINMGNHRINGVGAPVENSDAATKKYIDDRETAMRNDLVTKLSNAFTQVKINNSDTALAGIDFSDSAVYGSKAMKFKSAVPTGMGTHYATFGTSDKPYEYSWEYGSNESFNYVHNNTRVFAVADKAYAKDLILCALDANAAGPLYNNPVDVRAKLAELETAKNTMQTTIDNIVIEAGTKNIYYSDTAPSSTLLEDGDIWFDSGNLRLTVRHQGVWVFPDRVEDVALKSALYSAVSTATDFDTLKLKLMAALV